MTDRSSEPSGFGRVFSVVLGALAVGGGLWVALKGRRNDPVTGAPRPRGDDNSTEADAAGHPS